MGGHHVDMASRCHHVLMASAQLANDRQHDNNLAKYMAVSNVVCLMMESEPCHGWLIESVQSTSWMAWIEPAAAGGALVERELSPLIMFSHRANHDNMR